MGEDFIDGLEIGGAVLVLLAGRGASGLAAREAAAACGAAERSFLFDVATLAVGVAAVMFVRIEYRVGPKDAHVGAGSAGRGCWDSRMAQVEGCRLTRRTRSPMVTGGRRRRRRVRTRARRAPACLRGRSSL